MQKNCFTPGTITFCIAVQYNSYMCPLLNSIFFFLFIALFLFPYLSYLFIQQISTNLSIFLFDVNVPMYYINLSFPGVCVCWRVRVCACVYASWIHIHKPTLWAAAHKTWNVAPCCSTLLLCQLLHHHPPWGHKLLTQSRQACKSDATSWSCFYVLPILSISVSNTLVNMFIVLPIRRLP